MRVLRCILNLLVGQILRKMWVRAPKYRISAWPPFLLPVYLTTWNHCANVEVGQEAKIARLAISVRVSSGFCLFQPKLPRWDISELLQEECRRCYRTGDEACFIHSYLRDEWMQSLGENRGSEWCEVQRECLKASGV